MFKTISNYINEMIRGQKIRFGGKTAQWKKVAELKVGMKIAIAKNSYMAKWLNGSNNHLTIQPFNHSDVEFDEIVSIKKVGREKVWDIEVEGTHNFVGNGILAHNTYLNGNVGIGTTSPSYKLDVSGSIRTDGQLISTVKTGTAPLSVFSTTKVDNLNADLLDGFHASDFDLDKNNELQNLAQVYAWGNGLGNQVKLSSESGSIRFYNDSSQEMLFLDQLSGNVGIGTTSPGEKLEVDGFIRAKGYYTGHIMEDNIVADGSEESFKDGELLAISENSKSAFAKTNKTYQSSLLGLASKGTDGKVKPVIAGRFEAMVSNINGPIKNGDSITSSQIPGVGMRSTKAGPIVGKALEEFDPSTSSGQVPENGKGETIACPTEKTAAAEPARLDTFNNDRTSEVNNVERTAAVNGEVKCGKIMVFVNISWYDPDVYLTSTGDLKITRITDAVLETSPSGTAAVNGNYVYDGNLSNPTVYGQDSILSLQNFQLLNSAGQTIEKIGAFAEIAAAKIKAGLIEAENLIVNNILVAKNATVNTLQTTLTTSNTIVSKVVNSLEATISKLTVSEKITSPIVETKNLIATGTAELAQIETNEIKPQEKDLVIDLDQTSQTRTVLPESTEGQSLIENENKGELAKLIIRGLEGKTVATLDAAGNASFSGTLTAQEMQTVKLKAQTLEGQEVSLSGKLIAKEIEAENITDLVKTVFDQRQSLDKQTLDVNEIQALLAEIKNTPLPDLTNQTNLSNSTDLTNQQLNNETIEQLNNLTIEQLTVTGNANLYTASVVNSLTTGSLFFQDNAILSLTWELKLSALSTINLFDGAVMIAKDGTITTKGALIAQGGIRTNEIEAIGVGEDIKIKLSNPVGTIHELSLQNNPKLNIQNQLGQTVASIDASGSARFSTLSLNKYLDATSSAAVITASDNFAKNGLFAPAIETAAAPAGLGLLPENSLEVIIYNENIKENSLIYLTPSSDSPSPTLTVVKKEACQQFNNLTINQCKSYFKVAIDKLVDKDIKFNWLIIN